MRSNKWLVAALCVFTSLTLLGCSDTPTKSPDVTGAIRSSLDQAGFKDVNVSQDRDKGVVTLTGTTTSDADKSQGESIAKSIAGNQIVSDQIAVRPIGAEDMAKRVDTDLDNGGYYGYSRWGTGGGLGIVGTVIVTALILYFLGLLR